MTLIIFHASVLEDDQAVLQSLLRDHPTTWLSDTVMVAFGTATYCLARGQDIETVSEYYQVTFHLTGQAEPFHRCVILKLGNKLQYPPLGPLPTTEYDPATTDD